MLRGGDSQRKASMQRNKTNARDNHGKVFFSKNLKKSFIEYLIF